jgi:hypothetical protein
LAEIPATTADAAVSKTTITTGALLKIWSR